MHAFTGPCLSLSREVLPALKQNYHDATRLRLLCGPPRQPQHQLTAIPVCKKSLGVTIRRKAQRRSPGSTDFRAPRHAG
eukprot:748092-Amphidinium_carterae.1